jgi:hypothetical protein
VAEREQRQQAFFLEQMAELKQQMAEIASAKSSKGKSVASWVEKSAASRGASSLKTQQLEELEGKMELLALENKQQVERLA